MTDLLTQMLEKAKTDKRAFRLLKTTAVRCQQFELAAKLREIELELFPDPPEAEAARKRASELRILFGMVDLTVSEDVCWLIGEAIRIHTKKRGRFSLSDAAEVLAAKSNYFNDEQS